MSDVRPAHGFLRHSTRDGVLVVLSFAHAVALVAIPSIPLVAIALWWNANTVAHNFIHLPFFWSRPLNRVYSAYLTLVLGLPQSVWRERHLAHHAGRPVSRRVTMAIATECLLVCALWGTLAYLSPRTLLTIYLPGWGAGILLCQLQGHFEHARGTTSHYGWLYNTLFFNDGYHVEHHARPAAHWSRLKQRRQADATCSRWPPVLRWLDAFSLNGLERLVIGSARLQRFVISAHERAFKRLMPDMGDVRTVTIVGGGLFPRTAIVLRRLFPGAVLTIIDSEASHLDVARAFLGDAVIARREMFDPRHVEAADVIVAPLAYVGDRAMLYGLPLAKVVIVHDWIWARKGRGAVISWLLLKRLNVVIRPELAIAHKLAS